jgi:hypothetical protein
MIIKYQSDLFESFEDSLVAGWLPMQVEAATPIMRWKGPKISIAQTWWPMLAFYAEHIEHEVQTRFVMNEAQTEIQVICFNQRYGTGMSTKELDDDELQSQLTVGGWINVGTAHSHCRSAAFASHTDKENEAKANPLDKTNNVQVGLHATVGKLDEVQYDTHFRMVWMVPGEGKAKPARYATLSPVLEDWFELPPYFGAEVREDPQLVHLLLKYLLAQPPPKSVEYPQEWKKKLIEEVRPVYPGQQRFIPAGGYVSPHNNRQYWQQKQAVDKRPERPLYEEFITPNPNLLDDATLMTLEACKSELQEFARKQEQWMGLNTWWDLEPSEDTEFRAEKSPLFKKMMLEADEIAIGHGFHNLEEFFYTYQT